MRVIAIKDGHYDRYVPSFTIFDVDPKRVMKPGVKTDEHGNVLYRTIRTPYGIERVPERDHSKQELPSWMIPDSPENRKMIEDMRRNGAMNATAAALAANGPKRSKRGFAVAKGAEEAAVFEDISRRPAFAPVDGDDLV